MTVRDGVTFALARPEATDRAGNEAFEALYRAYAPDVRRLLIVLLARRGDAEDLVVETFTRALRAQRHG